MSTLVITAYYNKTAVRIYSVEQDNVGLWIASFVEAPAK